MWFVGVGHSGRGFEDGFLRYGLLRGGAPACIKVRPTHTLR